MSGHCTCQFACRASLELQPFWLQFTLRDRFCAIAAVAECCNNLQGFVVAEMTESQETHAASTEIHSSLVTAAMAYRVKYRLVDSLGKVLRAVARVGTCGGHKGNRGGVYPSGVRCRTLLTEILNVGFVKEEANHVAIAVQETPLEEIRSRGDAYVTGLAFNREAVQQDAYLQHCFDAPHQSVQYMLLSHNHLMLVLRAFLQSAKWDVERNLEKQVSCCDENGNLSVSAVAQSPNGVELAECIEEGLSLEVLSWKMDVEEPDAASIISRALNKTHELALRTTELTAVAVLKGEMIWQLKHVGKNVAFATVRDKVRHQLCTAADDPDLIEIYDFLISLGVGTNTYIEDFMNFATTYVDSSKRQLRFSAFAEVNKLRGDRPWTKVALMKRAYRKKNPRTVSAQALNIFGYTLLSIA